jgi:proteasome accessory factor PafA2
MAVKKLCGIETEYGILGGDANPITASSILVNSFVHHVGKDDIAGRPTVKVGWDFGDETPGLDARGFAASGALPPEVETHLVNAVLTNGARFYVDHAHPEYSSPECENARVATLYDRAGEQVLLAAMDAARQALPGIRPIVVYKNNSDGKGNSYGTHENYLMDRELPFARIVNHVMAFFVTRQIFCGAGKVGCEFPSPGQDVAFQISQRADFFEEEVGLETTLKRPIVNTRDEPHADARRFRRLHVIVGDASMSEVATFLKLGATSIVLAMIEDGFLDRQDFGLAQPVRAIRQVSWDPTLGRAVEMADGRTITALDLQWRYYEQARAYAGSRGLEAVDEEVGADVLQRWGEVLADLEADPMRCADRVDWVAKLRLIGAYRERHGVDGDDPRLKALDLQWSDLRPEKCLASRAGLQRLFAPESVERAVSEPPRGTRAYFRGRCLQRFSPWIVAANWDSLVFDLGTDPLRRVPMLDPMRGTADLVDSLLEGCSTPAELLTRLGA